MATGASISINVPSGVTAQLKGAAVQLRKINLQLTGIVQKMVAFGAAMKTGGNVNKAYAKSMRQSAKATQRYAVGAAGAQAQTGNLTSSMQTATAWMRQMAIGLYVVGGAATSIARPLIALSMIFQTYDKMPFESQRVERWADEIGAHFKWLGRTIKSGLVTAIKYVKLFGLAVVNTAAKIPILGRAVTGLYRMFRTMGSISAVGMTYLGGFLAIIGGLAVAAKNLADAFAPISEHIQRAISVTSLGQDQFDALAESIFDLQKRLEVFTTEEVASLVERMAYAGAIGKDFKETAMAIGQISYVTGMEMAQITRDMARLTSQTGEKYKDLANIILRTFAQASITYEETIESFQQAGMLLREDLGMTTADLGAITVQLEKFGYTGTRAATAMRSLAARSSEIKEGLRGAQQVFSQLGVEGLVKDFRQGKIALDELIMGFGEAGASYGHMVNIFNRRAGVAAAAIAEFDEAYAESVARIQQSSTETSKMFEELTQTYQGLQDRAEAARSRAKQEWGYTFRYLGKIFTRLNAGIWNAIANFGTAVRTTWIPATSIIINSIRLVADSIDWFFNSLWRGAVFIVEKLTWVVGKAAEIIPGMSAEPIKNVVQGMEQHRRNLREWSQNRFQEHLSTLKGAIEDYGQEVDLDVGTTVQYRVEQFESANESYQKEIGKNIKALNKFRNALHPEFLLKLGEEILSLASSLEYAKDNFDSFISNIEESIKDIKMMGKNVPWKKTFGKVSSQVGKIVNDFMRLGATSDYLRSRFKDVTKELKDMFGLSRSIERRHSARVQGTGEVIGGVRGEVRAGGGGSASAVRDFIGEENFQFMQQLVRNMEDFSGNFTSTFLNIFQKEGVDSIDQAWKKFIEMFVPQEMDYELSESQKTIKELLPVSDMFPGEDAPVWGKLNKSVQDEIEKLGGRINEALRKIDPSFDPEKGLESFSGNIVSALEEIGVSFNVQPGLGSLNQDIIKKLKEIDPSFDPEEGLTNFEGTLVEAIKAIDPSINVTSGINSLNQSTIDALKEIDPSFDVEEGIDNFEGTFIDVIKAIEPSVDLSKGFDNLSQSTIDNLKEINPDLDVSEGLSEFEGDLIDVVKAVNPDIDVSDGVEGLQGNIIDTLEKINPQFDLSDGIDSYEGKIIAALMSKYPDLDLSKGIEGYENNFELMMEAKYPNLDFSEGLKGYEEEVINTFETMSPKIDLSDGINEYEAKALRQLQSQYPNIDLSKGIDQYESNFELMISAKYPSLDFSEGIEGYEAQVLSTMDSMSPTLDFSDGVNKWQEKLVVELLEEKYNIDLSDAVKKLESGLSNELKGQKTSIDLSKGKEDLESALNNTLGDTDTSDLTPSDGLSNLNNLVNKRLSDKEMVEKWLNTKPGLQDFSGDFNDLVGQMGLEKEDLDDGTKKFLKQWAEAHNEAGKEAAEKVKEGTKGFWESLSKGIEDKFPGLSGPYARQKERTGEDLKWWQKLADTFLRLTEVTAYGAEGETPQGNFDPKTFDKLLSAAQKIANASEKLEEASGKIQSSAKATTNIERQTKNVVTVNLDQSFQSTFDIDVGGTKGEATEAMIRRAVDRAVRKLERGVRDSVDPEALEKLVVEQIEDQVKENEEGSHTRPGDWSE
ncbi:MAG: phage tail tape measure protein [Clostridiales bacterium]|nr:phage tail tape measure protein [Clostridiales bacterium]